MRLKDKAALVTGAQQGIGAAVATELAREGADVAINWLDDEAAANVVADSVRALGRRAALVRGDLGTVAGAQGVAEEAWDALGRLHVLVNNAGIYPRAPFLELTEATWDATHAVNLKATAFCAQAAARRMAAAQIKGAIINVASVAAPGAVRGVHYSASKGGVVSLTRAMALELARPRHPGQRHRAGPGGHGAAALRHDRGRDRRSRRRLPSRAGGRAGRDRDRRRVPRLRHVELHERRGFAGERGQPHWAERARDSKCALLGPFRHCWGGVLFHPMPGDLDPAAHPDPLVRHPHNP